MTKQEMYLSISLYCYFAAALMIAIGQDNVYYRCRDSSLTENSRFMFSCNGGKTIIVKSAIIGATDIFVPPRQCPITNNTCLKEITTVAELCTGRKSCDINQNILLYNESKLSCPRNGDAIGNFIIVNYTCIVRDDYNYGNICHFDEDLYNNAAVYISSYPNFPDAMGQEANYQCSCLLTSKSLSYSANVTIRALLVKLTGAITCSERLSVTDSEDNTRLTFCSPCNNVNNVTTVALASNPEILFRRDPVVSPYNGKFILEITVSSGIWSVGSIICGAVGSTISSSTKFNVTTTSPTYSSTTTTSSILSQPNIFSSTSVQSTSSGMAVGSSTISISTKQSTLLLSKPTSERQNSALSSSITPILAGRSASEKRSLSTGGIIGIVLGSVAFIVIVIAVLLCLLRKQKQHRDHSEGNTNFAVQQSVTAIQNMQTTNNIELHEASSSELHTFQSATHFRNEPQTTGYENNWQPKDTPMSNYEEGAPVFDPAYRPGMAQANDRTRQNAKIADDQTTETQSLNPGDGDITLVENQLYGQNDKPMTDVVASSDYAVVKPVVQDGRTDQSSGVDYSQMKNNSADHSYYNVTTGTPTEVSAEAETNSASNETRGTNPMYKADADVVLIDNTLYGSMLTF